jgi:hypothetical protein
MSWLATAVPPRTLGDALALRPELLAGCRALEAAIESDPSIDGVLRRRCRARVATLVGLSGRGRSARDDGASGPRDGVPADDVVLEFVEQFVLDAHGVGDDLVARLGTVLPPRGVVALAQAVAVWEGQLRLARWLGVRPEL